MFKIDKETNQITPLKVETFSGLGFRERDHLQEWIAKYPNCLGEDLLIIQKEFAGFSDTQERLDLLALDKSGNLVIIENKLDDTGRDVTWQAMKYASYCASLSNEHIVKIYQDFLTKNGSSENANEKIANFLDIEDFSETKLNEGISQRIILIAANFRKEVTSTVMWLLNYKMSIQCFEAKPFSLGDELLLKLEQIIPAKDTEEFVIGLAEKARSEANISANEKSRKAANMEFWTELIKVMQGKSKLYDNISPSPYHWIGTSSGFRGVGYNFVIAKTFGRTELYIDRGKDSQQENKWIFDKLHEMKDEIETTFGSSLIWERLDEKRASRVKIETDGNIFDKATWDGMIEFMTDTLIRIEKAFKGPLNKLATELKAQHKLID